MIFYQSFRSFSDGGLKFRVYRPYRPAFHKYRWGYSLLHILFSAGGGVNDLIMTGGALALTTTEMFTFNQLNGALVTGSAYTLISGAASANTSVVTSGWTTTFLNGSNYTPTYSFSGNDLQVTFAVIPEPRAALLGCIGVLLLLRRRR